MTCRSAGSPCAARVLGAKYVDNAMQSADAFNRPLQELLNEYCWGGYLDAAGLEPRTRSL